MQVEVVMPYITMLSWHLAGSIEDNNKISVSVTRVQADIWTRDLPKTKDCCFVSVLF